jgi:hypothetical protein
MIHPQAIGMRSGKKATSPFIAFRSIQAKRDGLQRRFDQKDREPWPPPMT